MRVRVKLLASSAVAADLLVVGFVPILHIASETTLLLRMILVLAVPALTLVALSASFVVLSHQHLLLQSIASFLSSWFSQIGLGLSYCRLLRERELSDLFFSVF